MHDLDVEGHFMYTDGTAVDFENWFTEQPDNAYNNQDCVNLLRDGTMNDIDCLVNLRFICKCLV